MEECMPSSWQRATIVPLHKKGDITERNTFRGISLLDVVYKVLATLMKTRIESVVELQIGEYQAGFSIWIRSIGSKQETRREIA